MMEDEKRLVNFLSANAEVEYIRLHWIDYSGILRTRFLPLKRCLQLAQGEEYLVPQVSMIIPVTKHRKDFPPGNEIETWSLVADWSSLRVCGFKPNHASVMCFVKHREASDPFGKCPRTLLTRALHRLDADCGSKALAGFEIEFMVLDGEQFLPLKQLDRLTSYQTTAGLRGKMLDIVEEIIHCLQISGVDIQHFHTETRDQIEIALSPESPLAAVDSLIIAQETIRTICVRHNIKATMTPNPTISDAHKDPVACPTNGIHLHISVDNLAPAPDHFLAGILDHTKALCAFGMASYDSYIRVRSDGVGEWVGFGTENRDLPVRKVNDQHWELRMLDATANPYLFTAASILAGVDGLTRKTELLWQDCPVLAGAMLSCDRESRETDRYGLVEPIPKSLSEALNFLMLDHSLNQYLSDGLLSLYLYVKSMEVDGFGKETKEDRIKQYLEQF